MLCAAVMLAAPALFPAWALAGGGEGPAMTPMPSAKEPAPPPIDMKSSWPCVQRKVDKISVMQIWDGPPIDEAKGWFRDEEIAKMVEVLTSRRISTEQAEDAVASFAKMVPEDKRDERLTLLFAGLFDRSTTQRRGVMSGIERYQKSQQERSRELERQSTAIVELENKSKSDEAAKDALEEANEKFQWAQRIFHERQGNIPLACELPVLIEERLFILARAIRNEMET